MGFENLPTPSVVSSSFLRETAEGTYISVKLQPRATKNQIGPVHGNELKISVSAPPVDSAANEALVRLLADTLKCPRSSVHLTRGQTSRHKVIFVAGATVQSIKASLGQ